MSATPEDVQTKISQAQALLAAASVEVGQLVAPSAPTPTPPTPTPPSGAVAQPVPPAFVVKRTLPAAVTWAEVQAGVNALQPGDRLPVKGVIFPASPTFTKALSAAAEIAFDAACKLQGGGKPSPPSGSTERRSSASSQRRGWWSRTRPVWDATERRP